MSLSRPTNRGSIDPPAAAQDAEDQRIVLAFLLGKHPTQLPISEVAEVLYAQLGNFTRDDAVERAIRDLVGQGLLCCRGRLVFLVATAPSLERGQVDR